ncbi:hypothetical protein FZ025_03330 [Xanthomonas hyacinthi]|nr:hypothetical protein [Xanthomonas hyacinthi]QGY75739.1 hypothetical protein FZ025_03330 [Xanthomonas hyacinthi]
MNFSIDKLRSDILAANEGGGGIFVVTHAAVVEILDAFLSGVIGANEVAEWAEFLDANEDVEFESDEFLPNIIFELSSPEINYYQNAARAAEIINILKINSG